MNGFDPQDLFAVWILIVEAVCIVLWLLTIVIGWIESRRDRKRWFIPAERLNEHRRTVDFRVPHE
jgi:hypothetical protein